MLSSNKELAAKLGELEHKLESHDQAIAGIRINAIPRLMGGRRSPQETADPGFVTEKRK